MIYHIYFRRKDEGEPGCWKQLRWSPTECRSNYYNFSDYDFKVHDVVYTEETEEWNSIISKIKVWDTLYK